MTDELRNTMKKIMTETEIDKKIRGILLCQREDGTIVPSNIVTGDIYGLSANDIKK